MLTDSELKDIVKNANINNSGNNQTSWKKGHTKSRKKIHQYSINGKFIKTWEYAKIAAFEFGCSVSNITMCASGKIKTAVGYKWTYDLISDAD